MHLLTSLFVLVIFGLQHIPRVYADDSESDSIQTFQYNSALQASQDAIGQTLSDFRFTNEHSQALSMADFRGKPLVISMIYTSCYKICPMTVRHLSSVVEKARAAIGSDSFSVAIIGFDTQNDNPLAMQYFANKQGISDKGWNILSADDKTIKALTEELGFVYFASPNGFDHLVQATIVDGSGKIYRQVYGEVFDTPLLVEPLLELVLDKPRTEQTFVDNLISKVRFFCTSYDPYTDSYHFDYSIFIGMFIGGFIILYTVWFIFREYRLGKQPPVV
ncbi:MAG: SCO family protein [Gammaproteobacteria bacterium]|nr:SCO family protein [Gammaproteobacteria bacterium]